MDNNEAVVESESTTTKGSPKFLLTIFTFGALVLAFGAFALLMNQEVTELDAQLQSAEEQLQQKTSELSEATSKIEELTCQGEWRNGSCVEPALTVVAPNGGETYCAGDDIFIKWQASENLETVNVGLVQQSGVANIGQFPARTGEHVWDGKYLTGSLVETGETYKIEIYTQQGDEMYKDTSDSIFSIADCDEGGVSHTEGLPVTFEFATETNLYNAMLLFDNEAHDVAPLRVEIGDIEGSSSQILSERTQWLLGLGGYSGVQLLGASTPGGGWDIWSGPVDGFSDNGQSVTFADIVVPLAKRMEMGLYTGEMIEKEKINTVVVELGSEEL